MHFLCVPDDRDGLDQIDAGNAILLAARRCCRTILQRFASALAIKHGVEWGIVTCTDHLGHASTDEILRHFEGCTAIAHDDIDRPGRRDLRAAESKAQAAQLFPSSSLVHIFQQLSKSILRSSRTHKARKASDSV